MTDHFVFCWSESVRFLNLGMGLNELQTPGKILTRLGNE
jgi:hypothetical protein